MPQFLRGKPGTPRVVQAPVYDIVGWVTEQEAAEVKDKVDPPERGGKTQRTTIARWRSAGYVQGFDLHGILNMVNTQQVIDMEPLPQGRPSDNPNLPPIQDPLPETITLTLRLRKGKPPRKWKGEPKPE